MPTKEEWAKAEMRLYDCGNMLKLKADEYLLTLVTMRQKSKLYLFVYVNDKFKMQWIQEDCDIRNKFMCASKRCLINSAELNKFTKSKKKQAEIKEQYSYISYSPYWGSFKKFVRHLSANCNNVSILEGEYNDKL